MKKLLLFLLLPLSVMAQHNGPYPTGGGVGTGTNGAGTAANWAPGVAVLWHNGVGTGYPSLEAANSNAVANDIIDLHGTLNLNVAVKMKQGTTINFNGAILTNNVDLTVGGPGIQPVDNCSVFGPGTIYPQRPLGAINAAAIGFTSQVGNSAATNFNIEDMTLWGESDVLYFFHTNYFNGLVKNNFIGAVPDGGWDLLIVNGQPVGVTTNSAEMYFEGNVFQEGPTLSSLSGSALNGIRTGYGTNHFKGNTHIVNVTTTAGTWYKTGSLTNSVNYWDNEVFVVVGTTPSAGYFQELTSDTTNIMNNCSFYGRGLGSAIQIRLSSALFNNVMCYNFGTNLNNFVSTLSCRVLGGNLLPAFGTGGSAVSAILFNGSGGTNTQPVLIITNWASGQGITNPYNQPITVFASFTNTSAGLVRFDEGAPTFATNWISCNTNYMFSWVVTNLGVFSWTNVSGTTILRNGRMLVPP